ncbi:MAG: hypothetical protein NC489_32210 [Ruminococcus flavefaciens]|nr:hypothetical protein [Ruminococcus flavefaciens]
MDNMTVFFSVMLTMVADFLGREPIIYLFGLACLTMVIKVFRQLLP